MLTVRIFFCLFLAGSLFATRRESRALSFGIGYRRDHLSFVSTKNGVQTYQENDTNLQGIEVTAGLKSRMKNIVWKLDGDIGSYLSGHSATNYGSQNAKGFFGDGTLALGYDLVLFSDAKSAYRIVPRTGYSAFYQELKYSGGGPVLDLTQTRLKRLWQGPLLGGSLSIRPFTSWAFEGGYDWYWFYFLQKSEPFFDQGGTYTWSSMQANFFGAHGQHFFGKFGGKLAKKCWCSFLAEAFSFITPKKKATERQVIQEGDLITSTKSDIEMKAWTHSFAVTAEIEYFF